MECARRVTRKFPAYSRELRRGGSAKPEHLKLKGGGGQKPPEPKKKDTLLACLFCLNHMKKRFSVFRRRELNVRTREKLVAAVSRYGAFRAETGEPSVTFCERGGASGRMAYFLPQTKNKPEQSLLCSGVAERVGFEPTALTGHRFSRPAP